MFNQTKKIFLLIIILSLPLMGFGCKLFQDSRIDELYQPIELNWWGVWEESSEVTELITAYQQQHPNVNIRYRKFRYEEYEKELTRAWLENRGPDIFSISSNSLKKYKELITPMPASMDIPVVEIKDGLKKEIITTIKQVAGLTPKRMQELFVDAVSEQAVIDDKVYGVPLNFDTLALYYNRDLLNSAKVPLPAQTWAELVDQVPDLTSFDQTGNIKQAAIALGTNNNIPRSSDILTLLMMQNGATMTDANGFVKFNTPPRDQPKFNPGVSALEFYISFANQNKETYTWTEQMPDALELFTSGKLAYFIGYSYQTPIIRAMAPKLNFGVSAMLQTVPDVQEINFADFWTLSVYTGTDEKNISPAWDFIKFITTTDSILAAYLEKTNRPTALRSLINDQIANEKIEIFADQLLNAKNWYRGYDPEQADKIIGDMIYQANHNLNSEFTIYQLLNITVDKLNSTIKQPQ